MKNSISKFLMIATVAAALFAAPAMQAAPGGGGSGTTAPTPVEEQAVPAKQAVMAKFGCHGSGTNCNTTFTIPSTHRFVIEHVYGKLPTAKTVPSTLGINFTLNFESSGVTFIPNGFGFDSTYNMNVNAFDKPIKLYVDSIMSINSSLGDIGSADGWITFVGYLVKK